MSWTNLLQSRADTDLQMYSPSEFDFDTQNTGKYVYIFIKDGKKKVITGNVPKNVQHVHIPRTRFIEYMLDKIDANQIGDAIVPLFIADSFGYESKRIEFSWAKPANKRGLLFPCWSFMEWEKVKQEFQNKYIPWTEREIGPYFIGANSTEKSGFREIIRSFYPNNVVLTDSIQQWRSMFQPSTNLMKYKLVFDLPGLKPWSVRSPQIALSGSHSIRFLQYYPKWGEEPWIQFYENLDDIRSSSIVLEGNYDIPIKKEIIQPLHDAIDNHIHSGIRKWARAKRIRENMMKLNEQDIVRYLEYILRHVATRQS
jgi:hypothetical protein